MIPTLDPRGLLPPGEHTATWEEVRAAFCTNTRREILLNSVRQFVAIELAVVPGDLRLVIGGSFLTDKDDPSDIEMTVYLEVTQETLEALGQVFKLGDKTFHGYAKSQYEVDFYLSYKMPGCNDFGAFFQYVGPKTASVKQLDPREKRGIIEVVQWKLG